MLYPLLFEPILKERIWGGQRLGKLFNRQLTADKIGESWDVACHKNGTSIISNGKYKGKSLDELIDKFGRCLLGNDLDDKDIEKFPLLIKMLDASDVLSVQVHPNDEYAALNENGELGKTEMWYIVDTEPGAHLYFGIKPGTTPQDFRKAIVEGNVEPYLCSVNVKKGDVLYIPAGMVHAIGSGIVICEIQQNSDTTYRVFDWNRVDDNGNPRQLHVEKVLDVIDFDGRYSNEKVKGIEIMEDGGKITYLVACPCFAVEKVEIRGSIQDIANGEKFFILTILEGEGSIEYNGGLQSFERGDSIMIPASLGYYSIHGECTLLKSYIPNRQKDIIEKLENKGFSRQDMKAIAGLFD